MSPLFAIRIAVTMQVTWNLLARPARPEAEFLEKNSGRRHNAGGRVERERWSCQAAFLVTLATLASTTLRMSSATSWFNSATAFASAT